MDWIHTFDLFLFDFDGLLVNTEHIHYQAYKNVFASLGKKLPFSLGEFIELAHLDDRSWKETLWEKDPEIKLAWESVYEKKRGEFLSLVLSGKIELMPGVEPLLKALEKHEKKRCVVTNSFFPQVDLIRSQIPLLKTIPHWITRERYENPKPNPEGYLLAIEHFADPGDKIIGFEDSVRGVKALEKTSALPVLICPEHYPLLEIALKSAAFYFPFLHDVSFS